MKFSDGQTSLLIFLEQKTILKDLSTPTRLAQRVSETPASNNTEARPEQPTVTQYTSFKYLSDATFAATQDHLIISDGSMRTPCSELQSVAHMFKTPSLNPLRRLRFSYSSQQERSLVSSFVDVLCCALCVVLETKSVALHMLGKLSATDPPYPQAFLSTF